MKSFITGALIATFVAAESDATNEHGIIEAVLTLMEAAWSQCRDDQNASVCAEFCAADSDSIREDWRRQACKWQEADSLYDREIY